MNYTEEAALFHCNGDALPGILTRPESPATTGVVVLVGGPQYRAGSHRQFVLLSRSLATASYATLRFDYRGMGDSEGEPRDFQAVSDDIAAAINALQHHIPSIQKVALWGLCDGASAALLYMRQTRDARISGLCLLNPWVRSEASLARTHIKHYYAQRLMQMEFWQKLLRGHVAANAFSGVVRNIRVAANRMQTRAPMDSTVHESASSQQPFQSQMATAWRNFGGGILLLLSGADFTAKEFLEHAEKDASWQRALKHPRLVRHDLTGADHTFSNAASRDVVQNQTLNWLDSLTKWQPA